MGITTYGNYNHWKLLKKEITVNNTNGNYCIYITFIRIKNFGEGFRFSKSESGPRINLLRQVFEIF